MALVLNDRVKETSTTTGTGTLDLGGAATGYQTFVAGIGNSNTCYYCISAQGGTQWEVGIGTVTDASTDTLSRDTIYANSAGNTSALTLSAGTKDVFVTQPASKAVYEDNSGNISVPGTVDGVDIATRDGVLTSTTTTANAALPKAGGTMSGNIVMSSANITMSGTETVDGRDLSADGTKLDGIEASADVTDASNVSSAGALMKAGGTMTGNLGMSGGNIVMSGSETVDGVDISARDSILTSTTTTAGAALPKAGGTMTGNIVMSGSETVDGRDLSTDGTKLDGIEASADVTDATNVNAAGALMNSDLATKGTIAVGDGSGDPTILSVGTDGHFLKADSSAGAGVAWAASSASVAADEIATGDSAVTIATSSGNITIDAQADDSDIILKGTDGGADTTFLTLDGSDAGTATFNHDIILGDNSIIKLGAAPDLQIYHDTSNSIIADSGTGALQLRGSQVNLMKADGSASLVEATDGGSVELHHNGTKMIETTADGVGIPDDKKLELGDGDDLQIYHETTNNHSIIRENGAGHLKLQAENLLLMNADASETYVECVHNGSTQLYYDNSKKVETASAGISVTGTIVATSNITAYSSDERLKDLKGTIDNALDKIDRVNGYYYTWNDTAREIDSTAFKEGIEIGVSAQEIEKILPEVVTEAPIVDIHKLDVDYKTVYYDKIVPLLIEGIKELNKKIRKLEEGQNK